MPVNSNEQQMKTFHPFLNYQKHQVQMESSIQNSEIFIIEDTHTFDKQNCLSEPIEVPDVLS